MFIPPMAHRTPQHTLEHILLGTKLHIISEQYIDMATINAPTTPTHIDDFIGIFMQSAPQDIATIKVSMETANTKIHSLIICLLSPLKSCHKNFT